MAQGVMRSNKTRDGIAAALADNIGYLEEQMYELEQSDAAAVQAATAAATAAASAVEGTESALTEMDAVLESLSLSRASRLNKPNLIKQNFWTSRNMPSSAVITETFTVPVEDAEAAASALTFTVTNEAITSSYVLHGVKSGNTSVVSWSSVSATFSAGSATITIAARSEAHSAAVEVKVALCTVASTNVPYGNASRIAGSSTPYLKSINEGWYPGDDSADGVSVGVVSLASADQITEPDNEVYDKALQFNITANSDYGNTEWLMYFYPYGTRTYTQGATNVSNYGQIEAMTPGKTYTVSCWARVISGTAAWVRFGYGNSYSNAPYNDSTNQRSGLSEWQEVTGSEWQRVWWTFEFNPVGDWYTETSETVDNVTTVTRSYNWYKKVCFGVGRKYTATLQLCGFRLVEGGMWLPTKYDELSERVDVLEVDVADDISTAVSTAQTALQAAICETDGTTATANHAVGDVFWMNGVLCKATAAIATGETITPGTNCETTTVEALIAAAMAGVDLSSKADKASPVFTGSISLGRADNTTVGSGSCAVGTNTEASGNYSVAVGVVTEAHGLASFAEGYHTVSSIYSHAAGIYTESVGKCQYVFGRYNILDSLISTHSSSVTYYPGDRVFTYSSSPLGSGIKYTTRMYECKSEHSGDSPSSGMLPTTHWRLIDQLESMDGLEYFSENNVYAEICGNGTADNARSNARTLDWSGNEALAGSLTLGKGTADETTITAAQLAQLLALLS